jgi:uncharacterized membrane protein YccC
MTCAALAATFLVAAPAAAQNYNRNYNPNYSQGNGNEFWRGAPSDTLERIQYLQQRIDRGRSDGSLTPEEAARAEGQLQQIRREAWQMRNRDGGRLDGRDSAAVQARLDDLSQRIRWLRHNGAGYGDRGAVAGNFATDYDARRYYREGPQYSERRLTANDEVYRGSDGRYYCKRNDGTTGLIVGGAAGALLGNVVDGGRNRVAGTLIGGAPGALAGRSIDQNSDIRCR